MDQVHLSPRPEKHDRRCPFCHADVEPQADVWTCPTCEVRHHSECALQHGRCSVFGCGALARPDEATVWEPARVPEPPVAFTDGVTVRLACVPLTPLLVWEGIRFLVAGAAENHDGPAALDFGIGLFVVAFGVCAFSIAIGRRGRAILSELLQHVPTDS